MLRESFAVGACMRGYGILTGSSLKFDDAAPVKSGDLVRVMVRGAGICKQLMVDTLGRWFLRCSDGLTPICRYGFTFDGEPQKLIDHKPGRLPHGAEIDPAMLADRKTIAVYMSLTGPDMPDFVAGVPWPGQAAALDAFPYPPEFDGRYARAIAALEAGPDHASMAQNFGIAAAAIRVPT